MGQLGNLGDDFNGPGTIATTTTRVSYGLEIGDEVHIDPTGSPIQLAGCPGSPMAQAAGEGTGTGAARRPTATSTTKKETRHAARAHNEQDDSRGRLKC